jgi:hypothetical protein
MEATGRLAKRAKLLGTDQVPDLEAMEYVVSHGVDVTHQHLYYRRLMEREPKWFAEHLSQLQQALDAEKGVRCPDRTVEPQYDGKGPCPTCGCEPNVYLGPDEVERLIEELLARADDGGRNRG